MVGRVSGYEFQELNQVSALGQLSFKPCTGGSIGLPARPKIHLIPSNYKKPKFSVGIFCSQL